MYTKMEILNIAKKQWALDYDCQLSDFEKMGNTVTENKLLEGRRIYENDGLFPAWAQVYSRKLKD